MLKSMKARKNKAYKRSHISERILRELLRYFSIDLNTHEAGQLTKICEFECDQSYFGAVRVRGKRGQGAAGKTPVFSLLKRSTEVYVKIVPDCSKVALMPIIQGQVVEGSIIHTDG